MDFLKDSGLPKIGVMLRGILALIVLAIIIVSFRYLFEHPVVLVLLLAAIGAATYAYIRHRKKKNRV